MYNPGMLKHVFGKIKPPIGGFFFGFADWANRRRLRYHEVVEIRKAHIAVNLRFADRTVNVATFFPFRSFTLVYAAFRLRC